MASHLRACHRCGKSGHLARYCSTSTCFRCNGKGHMAWECVERVICGKCGEKGHLQRNCKQIACHKCGRKGHIARFCNDPFAKAAEVERHERQQALESARIPFLSYSEKSDDVGLKGAETTVLNKDIRGPWDGLGVNQSAEGGLQTDRAVSACFKVPSSSIKAKKRSAPTSAQRMVSQRLKIVGVKSSIETKKITPAREQKMQRETGSTARWQGLVGYGSDDSDDECLRDAPD